MGFSGRIEDVCVTELMQFLALNAKTGKLALSSRDGHGVVVIRNGRIIYAGSNSLRDAFGNILIRRGIVTEETLAEALERQHRTATDKRLGAILIEMGAMGQAELEDIMRHQTQEVLLELAAWRGGFFRFDALEISERGEVEVDAREFLVPEGLNTQQLLLEVALRLDEDAMARAAEGEGNLSLSELIEDVLTPVLRGETTLMLMRQAAQHVSRGVLFAVRGQEAVAVGHFGYHAAVDAATVAELRIPLDGSSLLLETLDRREAWRGAVPPTETNQALLDTLGARKAREILLVPIVVGGRVAMVFYGDNLPDGGPLLSTAGLELAMAEAGLAMEKDALEARIQRLGQVAVLA